MHRRAGSSARTALREQQQQRRSSCSSCSRRRRSRRSRRSAGGSSASSSHCCLAAPPLSPQLSSAAAERQHQPASTPPHPLSSHLCHVPCWPGQGCRKKGGGTRQVRGGGSGCCRRSATWHMHACKQPSGPCAATYHRQQPLALVPQLQASRVVFELGVRGGVCVGVFVLRGWHGAHGGRDGVGMQRGRIQTPSTGCVTCTCQRARAPSARRARAACVQCTANVAPTHLPAEHRLGFHAGLVDELVDDSVEEVACRGARHRECTWEARLFDSSRQPPPPPTPTHPPHPHPPTHPTPTPSPTHP